MSKEKQMFWERYRGPIYPKPRYTVPDCLILLGESRKTFYSKVKSGRYTLTKDGSRSYMTHAALLDAAEGDHCVA